MQIQSIPLFVQVAETIKTRISKHEYNPGDFIPSSKELEKGFNVSNITIRRAMEKLTREGYIIPRRGMRAQVAEQRNDIVEIEITGDFRTWVVTAIGQELSIKAEVIDRQVITCPKPIRKILALDPSEKVERIKRVRKLKDSPISYYVNYAPSHLLLQIPTRELEKSALIDTFQKICKINLKYMELRVQASTADMDLASILHVHFGFPLFFVQNVYYSQKGSPVLVTHMYYRSDRYVYTAKKSI